MIRSSKLPLLPGYTFDRNVGQTRFHKSQHFELLKGIPIICESVKPGIGGVPLPNSGTSKFPSAYARGEASELPAWLAFDKQVLCFDCYFQETVQETKGYSYQIRRCKILFFLEDGTIQVTEPKVPNSGMPQGTLLSRQRVRFPAPRDDGFFDVLDFNVGREVELYGRVFKITDCDKFTRNFLNRCGIAVPDPVNTPEDLYSSIRSHEKDSMQPKKPNRNIDTFGQFLKYDRQVLRFGAYWDDRESEAGLFHNLEVHYYLADDTIEIKDDVEPNSGRDEGLMFLARRKVPKYYKGLPGPGWEVPTTVLNVFTTGFLKGRHLVDPINCGREDVEYYKDCDLAIGGILNIFGRKVVLTDCDPFTQEYYRVKYGLDNFTPYPKPENYADCEEVKIPPYKLPPWNGYGSYEDSAQNCVTVEPKAPVGDFMKFLEKDRYGIDSHILRFSAEMISKNKDDSLRDFIIAYYLADDTVSVNELARRNTGFTQRCFFSRAPVMKPGQEIFVSDPPENYGPLDFYVGNVLSLNEFKFRLIGADEYALRYMEVHCGEFPKSDPKLILAKIRETIRPIYRKFVDEHFPRVPCRPLPLEKLRCALEKLLGDNITEHEVITLGRFYNSREEEDRYPREKVRAVVHTELKRMLFDDFERLEENFRHKDPHRSGYLDRAAVYSTLRGINLPVDKDLLEVMLDKICVNADGHLSYCDILRFLDYKRCPASCVEPSVIRQDYSFMSYRVNNAVGMVDIQYILRDLGLEGEGETTTSAR